ncbi:MAG: VOC family protein [Chloroflexota bacterium]
MPSLPDSLIKGLTYALVVTEDMPRARQFFSEKLGLTTEDDMGDVFSQFTTRDGTLWGMVSRESASGAAGIELYLSVTDVDEAYRTWKSRGVEMVTEPWDAPFGRTFAFKDADGRVLHAYDPTTAVA